MSLDSLAINGGDKTRSKPWPKWPFFAEDEVQAAAEVLRTGKVNYWTGEVHDCNSKKVRGATGEFEEKFSNYLGAKHSISVANGTLALELCLHALSIGEGDEVIVPNRTFIATASACVAQGATPVFADIDMETQGLSRETISKLITPKTKAVICVHLGGWVCEMDEILELCQEKGLKLIEDCAQSLGASYKNQMSGTIGDMAAFSFCQDKIMTTGGEGGMVVTNNDDLYLRAWQYKDHGKNFHFFNKAVNHPLHNEDLRNSEGMYSSIGTNFRMTEMQAAIGIKQLEKLPSWIETRRKYASILTEKLTGVKGIKICFPPDHVHHSYYKFYIFLNESELNEGWDKDKIVQAIQAEGVGCQYGSTWGIGIESGWKRTSINNREEIDIQLQEHFPNDHKLGKTAIALQVHPNLDQEAVLDCANAVRKVFEAITKI